MKSVENLSNGTEFRVSNIENQLFEQEESIKNLQEILQVKRGGLIRSIKSFSFKAFIKTSFYELILILVTTYSILEITNSIFNFSTPSL